jgi:hypothetical protein
MMMMMMMTWSARRTGWVPLWSSGQLCIEVRSSSAPCFYLVSRIRINSVYYIKCPRGPPMTYCTMITCRSCWLYGVLEPVHVPQGECLH